MIDIDKEEMRSQLNYFLLLTPKFFISNHVLV